MASFKRSDCFSFAIISRSGVDKAASCWHTLCHVHCLYCTYEKCTRILLFQRRRTSARVSPTPSLAAFSDCRFCDCRFGCDCDCKRHPRAAASHLGRVLSERDTDAPRKQSVFYLPLKKSLKNVRLLRFVDGDWITCSSQIEQWHSIVSTLVYSLLRYRPCKKICRFWKE